MHKDKYLEMHNSIIQSVISQEKLKLFRLAVCHESIHSYLIGIRLPILQLQNTATYVAEFSTILDSFLLTPQALL